jgi:two-component system, cell cycle sensor histidine kinase and response regulator CckA
MEYIENIRKAADRGASLTRQLLSFSRKQPTRVSVVDLNQRIRETSKLLHPLMGDDVQIAVLPRSASAIVEADPSQLDQIVMNLAMNARDAMPHGGKLIIETENQELDDAFAKLDELMTPGKFVMLAVSDNGCGMDAGTISRIFDPFFTTKEVGKGTGLGLATVYGIVKQSGGTIRVYSEPGHGTTFKIYFPCAAHKVGLTSESGAGSLPPRREGTTILLVEDDEMMRQMTRQLLEEHGYTVIDAKDGNSALEAVASSRVPINLTLTDVVMRGMSGPELALRLIESKPGMKIVYASGYTRELLSGPAAASGIALLEKPFTRASLLNTIHAALG